MSAVPFSLYQNQKSPGWATSRGFSSPVAAWISAGLPSSMFGR
ncbi:hypothetical protein D777_02696 [Marinobacter nitratireducens]|uniref:Uncharacterized protein n=1 Tax=Marinobacter nitratireducens TaxID=1137280 RepID=A0A072MZA1_9GAMM|nr:hypothetical protein D777_02696 [Marinobacter nitratireducens]